MPLPAVVMPARILPLAASFMLALCACDRGATPPHLGRVAPDFTVSDGESAIHLANYRGQVILLNFWWSRCGPCIQETPALVELHHQRPDLAILSVSIDSDADSYRSFLRRFHIDLNTVRDPNQAVARLYGTDAWPETYIIDRNGLIRRKVVGDPDWTNPEIRAFLQGL